MIFLRKEPFLDAFHRKARIQGLWRLRGMISEIRLKFY
jgi:hypothetical protein